VLVGRGVRAERATGAETAALNEPPAADAAVETSGASVISPGQDPTVAAAPPPTTDDLSYPDRLGRSASAEEVLKSEPEATVRPPAADKPAPSPAPPTETVGAPDPAEAPGPGFAVQVAAFNVKREADAVARRLADKGYAAYVQSPADGRPSVYRVRVGTFKTKREADTVAARLKKEEKFIPWITR
jgi:cell division septation protein DedD